MDKQMLTIGGYEYEHTAALFDGRVQVEGVNATFRSSPLVSDIFRDMISGRFDVAELGLTYYLRTLDLEDPSFTALPIFPNRNFRHSAIFINTSSGIRGPQDLAGKTVGEFALYGHDAGVWPKGILSDDFGITPEQCSWVIGGTDHPIPSFDWIPQPVPAGVQVRHADEGRTLGEMLVTGEIDALISVDVPQALLAGSPWVARLFPDYEAVERDYFRRTGIFPPMHVIAIRRELVEQPGLLRALQQAYSQAKDIAAQGYLDGAAKQHMGVMTPWFSALFEKNRRLLSDDWWPYGVGPNRAAINTFLRYHHEQGLSARLRTSDDIFAEELLIT